MVLVLRFRYLDLALHLYIGFLAGIGVGVGLERAARLAPPEPAWGLLTWWRHRRRRRRPDRVRSLEELEHAVDFSQSTAFDVHYRLRPHLARVAAHRLAVRRGVDLGSQPEAAADLVGAAAWDLVRPDREPPTERNAPGIPLARLRAAVDALEAV